MNPVAASARGRRIDYQVQRGMVWCGLPLMVFTVGGLALAGLLPVPVGADWSTDHLVEFYTGHPTSLRAGLIVATIGLALLGPLTAVLATLMRRLPYAPAALATVQQMGGTLVIVVTVVPLIIMNTAAFRPDRDPAITMAINDFGWLLFITPISLFFLQELPLAVAILIDDSDDPVFPRWVGYVNVFVPLSFVPALLPYFVKSGPVAWQGVLTFYLGFTTFGVWVFVMMWASLRALRRSANTAPFDSEGASLLTDSNRESADGRSGG